MRAGYADTPLGQIHYVEEGSGDAVLMLHQTPRSWKEFQYVLPLLGTTHRAIAMDTLGYGASAAPKNSGEDTVEQYADGVVALLDALGIGRVALVGHHTGGIIAVEVCSREPDRISAVVLSCTPLVDEAGRRGRPKVDDAATHSDGDHLLELWRTRQPYYPSDRIDLLEDFMADAMSCGWRRHGGHEAVARFEMERRLPDVTAPVLVIGAPGDVAYRDIPRWRVAFPEAQVHEIADGQVPLPEHKAAEFTAAVKSFLAGL